MPPTVAIDEEQQSLLRSRPSSPLLTSSTSHKEACNASDSAPTTPETAPTGRNLTPLSVYILTLSRILGSGIFATPGSIFTTLSSPGLSLLIWLLGALLAFSGLAISLELGCMLPRSGGSKVYLETMYRRPRYLASTLVAVQAVLLGFTASNCIVFARYTLVGLGYRDVSEGGVRTLGVGLLTIITVVHGCFLRTGIAVQDLIGWVKVGLMGFMAVLGVVALFLPEGRRAKDGWWERGRLFEESNWDVVALSTAVFKVSYSFAGYDNVNNVLNEVKDPVRTLKRMAPLALGTVTVFYLLINLAYFTVVPLEEMRGSGELIAALFFEKIFGRTVGTKILSLLVATSAAGNVMVVTFALARVNQEVARQGFLPFAEYLSSSKPFGAPLGGLMVHYIPSVLVIVLPPQRDVYAFILDVEGYPGSIFAMAICVGTLLLRKTRPDLKRPFKAWKLAIWLRIAMSSYSIAAPFIPPKNRRGDAGFWYASYAVVGGGLLICGLIYWYLWTVLIPHLKGYSLEEESDVLSDGTTITKLVKVKDR